jgi:hypothetical protein
MACLIPPWATPRVQGRFPIAGQRPAHKKLIALLHPLTAAMLKKTWRLCVFACEQISTFMSNTDEHARDRTLAIWNSSAGLVTPSRKERKECKNAKTMRTAWC